MASTSDLSHLGQPAAVRQALSRGVGDGSLRRVARGLYAIPREDPALGSLSTSAEAVVEALQRRDGIRLLPSGAHAANLLGLSDQVPMRMVFLTDGRARRIRVGKREIVLKRTTPRQMATAGRISSTVIQALRWLGQEHIDQAIVEKLQRRLSPRECRQLLDDARHAPAWVAAILDRIHAPKAKRA
ncbi:MAG: hypothetical protein IPJ19_06685 [Planctomycetes bacterium]|nr:hypothetical protein [Planctomycetota bacterium]